MAKRKTSYHHGNLRQVVLDSAWKVIQTQGIEKFSLRGCAREAGVDPAAIYQHFDSKNAILEEVARIGFVQLANAMEEQAAAAESESDAKLIAVGCAYINFAQANPELFSFMFSVSGKASSGATIGQSRKGRNPYQILIEACSYLSSSNKGDTISPLALWSAVHGIADLLIKGFGPKEEAQTNALIQEICRSMLDGRKFRLSAGV